MLAAVEAVEAVEVFQLRESYINTIKQRTPLSLEEARKRIPDHLKGTAPYSAFTTWTYYNRTYRDPKGESCIYCKMFDGQSFTGSQLRSVFPDHIWVGDDIYPNVHKTLWDVDSTCSCLLIREKPDANASNLNMWRQLGTDWTEEPEKDE